MPALVENTVSIELKTAKSTGLSITQLGVPVSESTSVKKGKLHELIQLLDDGRPGRRFQNIRITGVKTCEGGVESAKLFVQLEAFGDDNVPVANNSGFAVAPSETAKPLQALPVTTLFLPYARYWFESQSVFEIPLDVFDRMDSLNFTVLADQVRMI